MSYEIQRRNLTVQVYDQAGIVNRALEITAPITGIDESVAAAEAAADRAETAASALWLGSQHGVVAGGSDITAALQDLIDEIAATGDGGTILLDLGVYGISDTIDLKPGVYIQGKGMGQYPAPGSITDATFLASPRTEIRALSSIAGPMIACQTPSGAALSYASCGVYDMALNCNNVAQTGLHLTTVKNTSWDGIAIFRPTVGGFLMDVLSSGAPSLNNADSQFNAIGMAKGVTVWCGNSGSAYGFKLTGTTTANCNQNNYGLLKAVVNTGEGIDLDNCDNETILSAHTYSFNSTGIRFGGNANAALTARNNVIVRAEAAGVSGRILVETGSLANQILNRSTTNGTAGLVIQAGATIFDGADNGNASTWAAAQPSVGLGSSAAWTNGNFIARQRFFGFDNGGASRDYGYIESYTRGTAGSEQGEIRLRTRDASGTLISALVQLGANITLGDSTGTVTIGGAGSAFKRILTFSQSVDLPSISAGATHSFTLTATGAALGDTVIVNPPANFLSTTGMEIVKYGVSTTDTVTVYVKNTSASPIDLASGFWRTTVVDIA